MADRRMVELRDFQEITDVDEREFSFYPLLPFLARCEQLDFYDRLWCGFYRFDGMPGHPEGRC